MDPGGIVTIEPPAPDMMAAPPPIGDGCAPARTTKRRKPRPAGGRKRKGAKPRKRSRAH